MSRPGYLFIVCPDAELLRTELARALSGHGAEEWERKPYWGDEDLPETFWKDLTLKSLFSTPKALVVRRAQNLKAAEWDKLDKGLANVPADVLPVFCLEGKWDRGKVPVPAVIKKRKPWKLAEKHGWVIQTPGLTAKTMSGFIQRWTRDNGIRLAPGADRALCEVLPPDATAATLELEKLALAAGDQGTITADLAELVAPHEDMDFFRFLDLLQSGGAPRDVWREVLGDRSGTLLFQIISATTREARTLWMMASGEQSEVRLPPFVKKKKQEVASRLGKRGAKHLFDLAFDAELSVKTGAKPAEQILDMLVADLGRTFAARPRR